MIKARHLDIGKVHLLVLMSKLCMSANKSWFDFLVIKRQISYPCRPIEVSRRSASFRRRWIISRLLLNWRRRPWTLIINIRLLLMNSLMHRTSWIIISICWYLIIQALSRMIECGCSYSCEIVVISSRRNGSGSASGAPVIHTTWRHHHGAD